MFEEQQAIRTLPLWIRVRKMFADVAEPCRSQQRIAYCMGDNIAVGMPHWPFIEWHFDATDDQLAALRKTVQVISNAATVAHALVFCSACR